MTFLDKLLNHFNLSNEEYYELIREPNLSFVPIYTVFNGINKVKEFLLQSIKENKKIIIYGDYDADGILATAILKLAFEKLNYNVDYYIPNRYIDGYGLNVTNVKKIKDKGYDLIITVDNGACALDAIKLAKELNIDLVITDHHEYSEKPDVKYFLHPKESNLKYTTSGAIVSFYLSYALTNKINPYLLTLGATSIISDVMPLKGENREIVKLGLQYLNKYKYPQFTHLANITNFDENKLSYSFISKINCVGRVDKEKLLINKLVKFFLSNDYSLIDEIKKSISKLDTSKREIVNKALKEIDYSSIDYCYINKLDILSGLNGLLANRILANYKVPVCIFSEDNNGNLISSLRTKEGFNLLDFINENKDLILVSGGHKFAASITIDKENYESFKSRFIEYSKNHKFIKNNDENIKIRSNEINFDNYLLLNKLSPFGHDFENPTFEVVEFDTSKFVYFGENNKHIKFDLGSNNSIVGFNFNINKFNDPNFVLKGKLTLDNYYFNSYVKLIIDND